MNQASSSFRKIISSVLLCVCYAPGRCVAQTLLRDHVVSPRLRALQKELNSGRRNALKRFWREIAVKGTPLVEPVEADEENLLVTFLWRAIGPTRNVAVFPLAANKGDMVSNLMVRLPDTNVWYISYRMRRDARFTYRISTNDSLEPIDPFRPADIPKRTAGFQPDPLNPHRVTEDAVRSLVELPDAPRQPFVRPRPRVTRGHIQVVTYASKVRNDKRRIWVYTPPGYNRRGEAHRLLVSFDGDDPDPNGMDIPTILDNMRADGAIPPFVAVLIENPDRITELSCNLDFADYLTDEIVRWVRQRYNVSSRPQDCIITGASLGGLAAAYTAMRHPEVFGNVLSQSGAFWWKPDEDIEPEWLTRQFAETGRLPLRFYIEVGLLENRLMLGSTRRLRDVLQAKGYSVKYREYNGAHSIFCWRGSFSDGLLALASADN